MISEKVKSAHNKAIKDGKNVYTDPETGSKVMTAQFLIDRGYCCGNGCRHCPYDEESFFLEEEEELDSQLEYDYNIN